MSKVYFIADLHLGHNNILKYRDFSSIEEHDSTILENILSVVNKRDTLWLLGDVVFERGENNIYIEMMRKISDNVGFLNVVAGNHCLDNKYRQSIFKDLWIEGIYDNIYSLLKYKKTWLSHVPMHESELRGKFCIHGHTHNTKVDDHRYFCVSCEQVDYKPISYQNILNRIGDLK